MKKKVKDLFFVMWVKNIRAWIRIAKNPNTEAWLKIVEDIMKFANEVNENKVPMLTRLRAINYGDTKNIMPELNIVSLWAAVGDYNPIERLRHLKAQVIGLREILQEIKDAIPITDENKVLFMNIDLVLKSTE